jgi:hypothetical protein
MIPKDTFLNLYLRIYQAEKKRKVGWFAAMGQTVRPLLADRPSGRRGLSARLERESGSTGCSGANNGPSAPGRRTVCAPRGLSAGVSWIVRVCRALVGPGTQRDKAVAIPSLSQTARTLPLPLFLALSQKKGPHLWTFDSSTPGTVRAHPRTLHEDLHHVIRVFFRISHSLSRILSKKVIRVW